MPVAHRAGPTAQHLCSPEARAIAIEKGAERFLVLEVMKVQDRGARAVDDARQECVVVMALCSA
eukprot:SAG25_NODE_2929_length_1310_cov_1.089182_1_plen_63_part_10